jgi:hypothetical protein
MLLALLVEPMSAGDGLDRGNRYGVGSIWRPSGQARGHGIVRVETNASVVTDRR